MGDLVADISVARAGSPDMAVTAVFAVRPQPGAQGPYVAAGYHDDDYHYTLPCVGGPTDRQAAAQPRLRLTAAAGRAATLQPPSRLVAHPSREFRLLPAVLAHESVTGRMAQVETIGSSRRW